MNSTKININKKNLSLKNNIIYNLNYEKYIIKKL